MLISARELQCRPAVRLVAVAETPRAPEFGSARGQRSMIAGDVQRSDRARDLIADPSTPPFPPIP